MTIQQFITTAKDSSVGNLTNLIDLYLNKQANSKTQLQEVYQGLMSLVVAEPELSLKVTLLELAIKRDKNKNPANALSHYLHQDEASVEQIKEVLLDLKSEYLESGINTPRSNLSASPFQSPKGLSNIPRNGDIFKLPPANYDDDDSSGSSNISNRGMRNAYPPANGATTISNPTEENGKKKKRGCIIS